MDFRDIKMMFLKKTPDLVYRGHFMSNSKEGAVKTGHTGPPLAYRLCFQVANMPPKG